MKSKAIIPLVLGLCMGLFAIKYYSAATKKAKAAGTNTQTVTMVRALTDIDPHTEILPEQIEIVEAAPSAALPANNIFTKKEDVSGRVSGKPIPMGVPIMKSMLAPEGTPAGMAGAIPPGYRAVSVKIDEVTGVSYQMRPGSWVDVIVVMDVVDPTNRRSKDTVAEVILQHVRVAGIGMSNPGPSAAGSSTAPTGKGKAAKSATLIVPEQDVPKLHLAATRGKITLAMRGEDDVVSGINASATANNLLKSHTPAEPAVDPSEMKEPISAMPAQSMDTAKLLGAFAKLANASSAAKSAQPAVPPHVVSIYRGVPQTGIARIENITFENGSSRIVVQRRGGGAMGGGYGSEGQNPGGAPGAPGFPGLPNLNPTGMGISLPASDDTGIGLMYPEPDTAALEELAEDMSDMLSPAMDMVEWLQADE